MSLNVELLKLSFERTKAENGGTRALGLRFYQRLFEKYPGVRPLFKTPPEEQHKKLMASIGNILTSVTQPEAMLPYLHAMGIRHVAYGTENSHYGAVAENLIAVLQEHLSKEGEWTLEMEAAWNTALAAVASIMIEASDHPERYTSELLEVGYLPNGFRTQNETPWELVSPVQ